MTLPKISIITICYNSEKTLAEAIESVLAQDYPALELIIIDGGSTDGSLDIINRYRQQIAVVVSEKDKGISDAFNKGIHQASGELIGILNSDDIMLPGALHHIAEQYDGATDVYRGNMLLWNADTGLKVIEKPSLRFPRIPFIIHVCHGGTFITREAYRKHGGYDIQMKYMMDLDLLTRFYNQGLRFKHIDAEIEAFRIGGVTNSPLRAKREEIRYFILKNGGNKIQYYIYYTALWMQDALKRLLNLIGEDFKRKLRYRHQSA